MLLRTKPLHARLEFQASAQSTKTRVYRIFFVYGSEISHTSIHTMTKCIRMVCFYR